MSYSKFSLAQVKKYFGLISQESVEPFALIPTFEPSLNLRETLDFNIPLALGSNTEKARSEMIISPILWEVKRHFANQISLFSGVNFTVNIETGLHGFCDFILSCSAEQLEITAPVAMLVEAKQEDLKGGLGQCIAEMYAAQIFNQREETGINSIFGVVTSGTNWKFLKLTDRIIEIDLSEYHVTNIGKILGILNHSLTLGGTIA